MIRAILFDLDGTLIDTWNLYIETYLRTLEPYVGHRLSLEELRALHPTSEMRALHRVVPPGEAQQAHTVFLDHYRRLHLELFGGIYPGVSALLDALRTRPLALGLVTGKSRGAWEITRAAADLGPFDVFVGDDDVQDAKPSPEGLVLALQRLGVPPAEAVYVGDSPNDAAAARDAGMRYAAALWAKSSEERPGFVARVREVGLWAELPEPAHLLPRLNGP
ncbi:MAG: HAD-IA family hydrolase [Gemmatimonadota bacterium]|nr:HAD-IA family hydrolase [Gemmatimonadota bacterium]